MASAEPQATSFSIQQRVDAFFDVHSMSSTFGVPCSQLHPFTAEQVSRLETIYGKPLLDRDVAVLYAGYCRRNSEQTRPRIERQLRSNHPTDTYPYPTFGLPPAHVGERAYTNPTVEQLCTAVENYVARAAWLNTHPAPETNNIGASNTATDTAVAEALTQLKHSRGDQRTNSQSKPLPAIAQPDTAPLPDSSIYPAKETQKNCKTPINIFERSRYRSIQDIEKAAASTTDKTTEPEVKASKKNKPKPSAQSSVAEDLDLATAKAIAEALNEHGTRHRRHNTSTHSNTRNSKMASPQSPVASSPQEPSRSEAAKIPATKSTKKGVAKKPPPAKKRKINDGAEPPISPVPSTTEQSTKKKPKNTKARKSSQAGNKPASEAPQDTDSEDVEDPDVVYCICRKPDNHTWMIGCDGGCDDWFHGQCVGRKPEEKDLIDRFVCPNCTERGASVTTWKPMCRLPGCNRPARLKKGGESKYCSDDCGVAFFTGYVEEARPLTGLPKRPKSNKSKHSRGFSKGADGYNSEVDEAADLGPLGGPIRVPELKALVDSVSSAAEFRRLGSAEALTPPNSRPGTAHKQTPGNDSQYTSHESARLAEIAAQKSKLRDTRMKLKQREDLLRMTRERANRYKDKEGLKNFCGYDPRLAWDQVTFAEWLESDEGKYAIEKGTLSPPPSAGGDGAKEGSGDRKMSGTGETTSFEICKRKHCGRHGGWQKLALQDLRHDEQLVREEMEGAVREEQGIRNASEARKGVKEGPAEEEGSVEVVD